MRASSREAGRETLWGASSVAITARFGLQPQDKALGEDCVLGGASMTGVLVPTDVSQAAYRILSSQIRVAGSKSVRISKS